MKRTNKNDKLKHNKGGQVKKLRKEPDYKSLQRAKDALAKSAMNRKKEIAKHNAEERYAEVSQGLNAPEAPIIEQSAAHEAYRTTYFAQFKKVVDGADVLLEVLDARDPIGCRSKKLEDYILKRGKRIVLILNKADLVPLEILNKWLVFLRREFPTIPFKSSSQPNKSVEVPLHDGKYKGTDVFGIKELIKLLNQLAMGSSIVAGVFGPPNVGKSSVINSISRRAATGVASTPGFTKVMQEVEVTARIRILDCPGVVPSSGAEITPSMVLRNSIKIELLDDPVAPVSYILDKVPKEQLVEEYGIESYGTAEDFLSQLAVKRGKIQKGGEPDINGTARTILDDWNHGRIKYYTVPPEVDDTHVSKIELVDQDGTSYNMGKVINYTEEDFKNFQIQHVFQVIPKKEAEAEKEENSEDEDEEKPEETKRKMAAPKVALSSAQKEEMDSLAQEFTGLSFEGL
ncbi:hypothetical protein TVAG_015960 [Trichomonas vaginalis G3]|uniref:CP-type G domain-containing protein n=1 Tax=Trichomonas vaginalis (strain ATCC PRA-98 / G3) TaxID=412133 RepID=A2DP66_TRIV3|nr:guanine nucleotide-binding protein-like family [Trichomonas vaginalis G3]EAY17766.1 hypothetical protein TVAG_015960 [Trichomonas vaginalis G3]KAI5484414.1 guanine nucleotide-binding protein-like family [Trichomonas vaginalis G3]|eukprot:XP_001329901.1 hypothetical protein [Trichomonas vaginalis G3]